MELHTPLRPVLAVLAAILAGLTLAASAIAVAEGGNAASLVMPGGGCLPNC